MTPTWYRRRISLGDEGPDVRIVRRKLGLNPDGPFDRVASERIRGLAKAKGIKPTGDVTADVAAELGEAATADLAPEWFQRELELWQEGEDVRALRLLMGLDYRDNRFDPDLEAKVRQFQSQHQIMPNGRVSEDLAKLIGEA